MNHRLPLPALVFLLVVSSVAAQQESKPIDPPAANAIEMTQTALKNLREEKADVADTLKDLLPIAKDAAALIIDELRRSRFVPKYADQLIRIISTMSRPDLG